MIVIGSAQDPEQAPVSREEVEQVALLCRLEIDDGEARELAAQMSAVLSHAAALLSLDTSGVDPTAHPLPLVNVLRTDEVRESLAQGDVLSQAPDVEAGRFRVPPVRRRQPEEP